MTNTPNTQDALRVALESMNSAMNYLSAALDESPIDREAAQKANDILLSGFTALSDQVGAAQPTDAQPATEALTKIDDSLIDSIASRYGELNDPVEFMRNGWACAGIEDIAEALRELRSIMQSNFEAYVAALPAHPVSEQAAKLPPAELTWLYTHCRAIGMTCKSDSGAFEHDIALFTQLQQERISELEAKLALHPVADQPEDKPVAFAAVEDARELWKALNTLLFDCDGIDMTLAPSRVVYDKTFAVMEKHKWKYAATSANNQEPT